MLDTCVFSEAQSFPRSAAFQQDRDPTHITRAISSHLDEIFPNSWIGKIELTGGQQDHPT